MTNDTNTTLTEMKTWISDFCEARGWAPYHGPKDLAIGLVTESSELLEIFRFVPESDISDLMQKPERREAIADELADSLYFILRFAEMYGFDLAQACQNKLKKNAIKYPAP